MNANADSENDQAPEDKETNITLLHGAALEGLKETAAFLIRRGFDVNASTSKGFTPLHSAAMDNHHEVAELLLGNGANSNARNNLGGAPLVYAALKNHARAARLLLKRQRRLSLARPRSYRAPPRADGPDRARHP